MSLRRSGLRGLAFVHVLLPLFLAGCVPPSDPDSTSLPKDSGETTTDTTPTPDCAGMLVARNATEVALTELWFCVDDDDCLSLLDGLGLAPGDAWEVEVGCGYLEAVALDATGACASTSDTVTGGETVTWEVEALPGEANPRIWSCVEDSTSGR